jgi:hypothetical protein
MWTANDGGFQNTKEQNGIRKENHHPSMPVNSGKKKRTSCFVGIIIIAAVFFWFPSAAYATGYTLAVHAISITAGRDLLKNPITRLAIQDVRQLLQKGFPHAAIRLNDPSADVQIVLPRLHKNRENSPSRFAHLHTYDCLPYPNHGYTWRSLRSGETIILKLDTPSSQGVSFGLYGLLQEKLGFQFYHPG